MRRKTLETVGMVVNGLSIALYFFLVSAVEVPRAFPALTVIGLLLFATGMSLVVLSVIALVRNQGAGLIDRGVFGWVRHPMYLGAMLLFASFFFLHPHWLMLPLSAVNIAIVYSFILQGDQLNQAKFGSAYTVYAQSVPRINLLAGILRRLRGR